MLAENGRRDITQIIQKLEPERRYQVGIRLKQATRKNRGDF